MKEYKDLIDGLLTVYDKRTEKTRNALQAHFCKIAKDAYEDGFNDAQKEKGQLEKPYEHGLNESWEIFRRIVSDEIPAEDLTEIFDVGMVSEIFETIKPLEAIEKLKEYDKKIEEKESFMRKELYDYCLKHKCSDCPIAVNNPYHTCGRTKYFYSGDASCERVSGYELRQAYRVLQMTKAPVKVGDEVTAENGTAKFVVTHISENQPIVYSGVDSDGKTYCYNESKIDGKTGKTFTTHFMETF